MPNALIYNNRAAFNTSHFPYGQAHSCVQLILHACINWCSDTASTLNRFPLLPPLSQLFFPFDSFSPIRSPHDLRGFFLHSLLCRSSTLIQQSSPAVPPLRRHSSAVVVSVACLSVTYGHVSSPYSSCYLPRTRNLPSLCQLEVTVLYSVSVITSFFLLTSSKHIVAPCMRRGKDRERFQISIRF